MGKQPPNSEREHVAAPDPAAGGPAEPDGPAERGVFVRWRRRVLWLMGMLGLLLALVLGATGGAVLWATVRPQSFVQTVVGALLAREVRVGGEASFAPSLRPRLIVEDLRIAGRGAAAGTILARIGRLDVTWSLAPVLSGLVALERVAISDAGIVLPPPTTGAATAAAQDGGPDGGAAGRRVVIARVRALLPALPLAVHPAQMLDVRQIELRRLSIDFGRNLPVLGRSLDITEGDISAPAGGRLRLRLQGEVHGQPLTLEGSAGSLFRLVVGNSRWPVRLTLRAADALLSANGTWALGRDEGPSLALALSGTRLDRLGPLLRTSLPALGPYRLAARLRLVQGNLRWSGLEGRLGKSAFTGDLSLILLRRRPRLLAHLDASRLDPADLKPQAAAEQAAAAAPEDTGYRRALPVPLFAPLDLEIDLQANVRTPARKPLGRLHGRLAVNGGLLALDPLELSVGQGRMAGTLRVDVRTGAPRAVLEMSIVQLDYGRMLKTLALSDKIEGHLDGNIALSGRGRSVRDIVRDAQGTIRLSGGPGLLDEPYLDVWAAPFSSMVPIFAKKQATHMNCMVADFVVSKGVVETRSLLLDTARISVVGTGSIDLRRNELDLLLKPASKEASLLTFATPVRITGPLVHPKASPDKLSVVKHAGWLLLGSVNPLALIVGFGTLGADDVNPCVAALERLQAAQGKR